MTETPGNALAQRAAVRDIEQGTEFAPKFDADGLIPAIVTDRQTGDVLMFAWMNEEALIASLNSGIAHFWSRSRAKLWKKGEGSGNVLMIEDMRTDCDQDALLLRVRVGGQGIACHTGAKSCFYRSVSLGSRGTPGSPLVRIPDRDTA